MNDNILSIKRKQTSDSTSLNLPRVIFFTKYPINTKQDRKKFAKI